MRSVEITAEPDSLAIDMSREFDATPEQLLKAHTDPDLLAQWLGPHRLKMKVGGVEARHGGRWHYTHVDEDGSEYGFKGVFHGEPSVENGITQTFEFDGAPGHVCLETLKFDEIAPGHTVLRIRSVYMTLEDRAGMLSSGMETGVTEGYERLDSLLEANKVTA